MMRHLIQQRCRSSWWARTRDSSLVGVVAVVWLVTLGLLLRTSPLPVISDTRPDKISERAWLSAQQDKPVDVIVLLNHQANVSAVRQFATRKEQQAFVHQTLFETAVAGQADIRRWLDKQHIAYRSFYIVNALQLQADAKLLAALSVRDDVKQVITNPRVALATYPVDTAIQQENQPAQTVTWGVQRIRAQEVWAMGFRGQNVIVAGQDTGYDWDHPALINTYLGWDGVTANHDYVWHDAIHSGEGICGADSPVPCDDHWHGTHTMGTKVGETESEHIGVAPGARWMGCRNMLLGIGTPASYAECFEFFIAPYPVTGTFADGNPAMAPDIINNSWSCPLSEGCDNEHIAFLNQVVGNVRAAGIMVVASAGNDGSACGTVHEPPAIYESVYAVGATQSDVLDTIAYFSSRGTSFGLLKPDISAPGVTVRSSVPGTGYSSAQGTSMASPHVVGAIALLWSARPDLKGQIQATQDIVNQTAAPRYSTQCGDPAFTVPNNVYGSGRVDALSAVRSSITTLAGSVVDDNSMGVSGATVQADRRPEQRWETQTDEYGWYHLHPLSGTYTVTFSKPAYVTQVYTGITVSLAQTTTLAVTLTQYNTFLPLALRQP
ncbi:MAG: S8 family serine peptidase [Anaerolineae bacterium]|nr:S8 family serine peptidase [Anaerolineae bacterium]